MRTTIYATFVAIGASLAACGGSSSSSGGSGTCTPGQTATIGITSSGVSPTAVCVVPSGSVTFRTSALGDFVGRTGADELIIASQMYDHDARLRSYEIFADARRALDGGS